MNKLFVPVLAAALAVGASTAALAGPVTGAAIGAGTGAIVAGPPGAVVGGVAGAVIGSHHHRHWAHCSWRYRHHHRYCR